MRCAGNAGEYVMVTEDAATPFSVIAPIGGIDVDGLRLYKTFSELPIDSNTLSSLFQNATVVALRDWWVPMYLYIRYYCDAVKYSACTGQHNM